MKKMKQFIAVLVTLGLIFSQSIVMASEDTVSTDVVAQENTEVVLEETTSDTVDENETSGSAAKDTEFGPENFVKGKKNTFYAMCWWPGRTLPLENIQTAYWDIGGNTGRHNFFGTGLAATIHREVQAMIAQNKTQPEGRVGVTFQRYQGTIMNTPDYKSTGLWYDGADEAAMYFDQCLSLYKRMGGPEINVFFIDIESKSNLYNLNFSGLNKEEVFDRIVNDPRYLTEIRPELERLGFDFCYEEGKNELFYGYSVGWTHYYADTPDKSWVEDIKETGDDLRPGGFADNYLKLHAALANYMEIGLYDAVYQVAKKHYPDAIVGNYNSYVLPEEKWNAPIETQGYTFGYTRNVKVGNASSSESYGYNFSPSWGREEVYKDYPWKTVHPTIFNGLRGELIQIQTTTIYSQDNIHLPWIGNYSWRWGFFSPAQTRYWDETVIHYMMTNSLPWYPHYTETGQGPSDDYHLSELLYEMDEVLGFEDRKLLIEKPMTWREHYLLSGNYAGGRNVWRITPDLSRTDFEIEDFLYDEEKMIFKIGNQFIDFPDESYIWYSDTEYEHRTPSMFGYWVISPEGTRPVEYIDESFEDLGEPDILTQTTNENVDTLQKKQEDAYARYLARKNKK